MTHSPDHAERAREVLLSTMPDHMGYAPIASPAGTGYAVTAMLAYADERVAAALRGRKQVVDALDWALAEIDGKTEYTRRHQRRDALSAARAALHDAKEAGDRD